MKRFLPIDLSMVLSLVTVLGMAMAVAGRWPPSEALGILELPGLVIVYLTGGLPTCSSAGFWSIASFAAARPAFQKADCRASLKVGGENCIYFSISRAR